MKKHLLFVFFLFSSDIVFSQTSSPKESDTLEYEKKISPPAFKALQIVTGQSTKLAAKNEWYFVIAHRFGDISTGFKDFFGLDQASTKLGGIYGITDNLSVSFSRETNMKTFEFGGKYQLLKQSDRFPVSVVGYNVLAINTALDKDNFPNIKFSDRLSYLSQALISKRFNENFSLPFSPTYIHKNLYDPKIEDKDQFLAGLGGRYKISKRIALTGEYFVNFDDHSIYKNPLSLGIDLETRGHIFQLLFTNSQLNSDIGYLTNAIGKWEKGQIFFGFNIYRVF